jgi:glycosyltransferase involved in cell wall biosynthesis
MSSSSCNRRPQVAVVVSAWPRVSETFAVHELLALLRAGMLAGVFATKPGDRTLFQPGVADLDVATLPDGSVEAQAAALGAALGGRRIDAIHGYFAHRPADVAARAAGDVGVRYGFSAHALDVRKADDLAARARGAAVVVACNADVAASLAAVGARPEVIGHGVDIHRFHPPCHDRRDGERVLAVGRLVEKKGFDVLLHALARTADPWRLDIVGDGPERRRLADLVERLGLGGRVRFRGRLTHACLPAAYAAADVVVVPSRVDRHGDRDGLPNVVLEAMASARPVVASDVAAVATAVGDGDTGLLIPPDDPEPLAAALDRLAGDAALRRRLGARARRAAVADHNLAACGERFTRALERAYG